MKTYILKIQKPDLQYFNRLFAEAKWFNNQMIEHSDMKSFDTKITTVDVKRGENIDSEDLNFLCAQMRQQMYQRMWDNLKGLSSKKKRGHRVGRLKFRSYINSVPLANQTFKFKGNRLKVAKSPKTFRVRGLHQLGENPNIRSGCLLRKPSGFYISVVVKIPDEEQQQGPYIGLDMGVKDTATFATLDESVAVNFNNSEIDKDIRLAHKSISRKKLGSRNREKAKLKLRKLEEKSRRQQDDAVNKLVNKLESFSVCMQDELLSGWQRRFGQQMQHNIHGRLKSKLKQVPTTIELPASEPTTQLCPRCGLLNRLDLRERVYLCNCGYSEKRDIHSARNMIRMGAGSTFVESKLDVLAILKNINNVHLTVKQEFSLREVS